MPSLDVSAFLDCLASHGIREAARYQPASRYWAFQWTETAIYFALALALAGYCFPAAQPPALLKGLKNAVPGT